MSSTDPQLLIDGLKRENRELSDDNLKLRTQVEILEASVLCLNDHVVELELDIMEYNEVTETEELSFGEDYRSLREDNF